MWKRLLDFSHFCAILNHDLQKGCFCELFFTHALNRPSDGENTDLVCDGTCLPPQLGATVLSRNSLTQNSHVTVSHLLLYPPAGLRPQQAFSCILHFIIYTAARSACVQIRQMLDCHNAFSPPRERLFRRMCLSSRQTTYYYSARYL